MVAPGSPRRVELVAERIVAQPEPSAIPGPPPRDTAWLFAPDLAIAFAYATTPEADRALLARDFLGAGTGAVWVVDSDARGVEVHTPGAALVWLDEAATLEGGSVLPGCTMPGTDVFAGVPREG